MSDGICFAGLDVHVRKTAAAAVVLGSGEVWKAQLPGSSTAAIEWLRSLPGEVRAVYEAGPTGFALARAARAAGVEVMVCAPGAIPRQPGDRIKTDVRDALKLARLHAAGQLRPVLVPAPELEALRDLVRAREDLRGDLMRARHRISKLLLRRGLIWTGPGEAWADRHLQWLAKTRFEEPLAEVVFGEYLAHHEVLLSRRTRLDALIVEESVKGPWSATVARLSLSARHRHADRGRPGRRDRRHHRIPTPKAAGQLSRPRAVRALLRYQAQSGFDHQSRLKPCPPSPDRGGLALPTQAQPVAGSQTPPTRPAARGDRRRLAGATTTTSPLVTPRWATREEAHDRRRCGRTRTRVLRLGDRQPTRLNADQHSVRSGGGGRRRAKTGSAMPL